MDLVAEALARVPAPARSELFPGPLLPAAVLVLLLEDDLGGWQVLLTRRSEQLRDHPGQISFPGGRFEARDGSPAGTALREVREEVGIGAEFVEILGYLPPQPVVTGFAVSPVVGRLRAGYTLRPDPDEVAEIFMLPLAFLADSRNLRWRERTVRGVIQRVPDFQYGERQIWGATAQILCNLRKYTI